MANVLVEETSLSNIASAIREKNGGSATYKPGEMAAAISNLPIRGKLRFFCRKGYSFRI